VSLPFLQLVYTWLMVCLSLKQDYSVYCKEMSETGQGLLNNGQEDQIVPGSEIGNIWSTCLFDKSQNCLILLQTQRNPEQVPWCKQMHALMGMSPVIDQSAIAHSATLLYTSILA
jgi:ribosomal protein L24E